MGQSVLVNLPANSVTIADVGGHLDATTAEEALREICIKLDALLAPSLHQYAILPSFPNTSSSMYEGMAVYSLADKDFACCTTVGEHEVDALTVETGAVTSAGDVTVELNGESVTVAVDLDDTAEQVAAKIKAAVDAAVVAETIGGWTISVDGADITFVKDVVGVCVAPTATDQGLTGVTFITCASQNEVVAAVWESFLT